MYCQTSSSVQFEIGKIRMVSPGAAEGRVEAVLVERLLQPFRLPHVGVERSVVEWVDPPLFRLGVLVNEQFHARFLGCAGAQVVHRLELPGGVDVQQRERRGRGVERLPGEVQHHRAVLADRIEHDGLFGLRHHLAHDVDRFGLEALEVSEGGHQFRAFFRRARLARHVMLRCGEGVATSALPVHKEKVARC